MREAVRQNFNLATAAKALFTSQPGVSKAIIELEDELGVEIFRRHGKRIRTLTEPGKRILSSIKRILDEVETLKRVGKDFASQDQGNFVIATTHTQARYALPKVLTEFTKRFPKFSDLTWVALLDADAYIKPSTAESNKCDSGRNCKASPSLPMTEPLLVTAKLMQPLHSVILVPTLFWKRSMWT